MNSLLSRAGGVSAKCTNAEAEGTSHLAMQKKDVKEVG